MRNSPLAGLATLGAVLAAPAQAAPTAPADVVAGFLAQVRSGSDPDAALHYLATRVAAHQLTSEGEQTVYRTPQDYADHVRDFQRLFGPFVLHIEELIAQGDRVYARWQQSGRHLAAVDGEIPTGAPLREISSAVYRVVDGRIVEYWIQTDRKGLELQLHALTAAPR